MKQLETLKPILEGFNKKVLNGKVIEKPEGIERWLKYGDFGKTWKDGSSWSERCREYNQAQEFCLMPRVMEFHDELDEIVCNKTEEHDDPNESYYKMYVEASWEFIDFAKLKPQLWMYIPCNEEGEVLEEPTMRRGKVINETDTFNEQLESKWKQYQTAKNRVLFEGWEYHSKTRTDKAHIIYNGSDMLIFQENGIVGTMSKEIFETLEDAFISVPHYMDLTKLK